MVKGQPNTSFVFKMFRYYLQNGAALMMGYLKISWATSIFHQLALLATMCFCLISTPGVVYSRFSGAELWRLLHAVCSLPLSAQSGFAKILQLVEYNVLRNTIVVFLYSARKSLSMPTSAPFWVRQRLSVS